MQCHRPSISMLAIAFMLSFALVSCQTTDSEETSNNHTLALTFAGLSNHVYPDSATWDIAQSHGNGSVSHTSDSIVSVVISVPQRILSTDTIWVSLWTAGIRTAKIPYLYANDNLLSLSNGKSTKDSIAWNLLAARDSLKITDLTNLYARLLFNKDSHVSGFPLNCPVGIDTEAVKKAGIFYAVDSQGWSCGALSSLGMDSIEAATEKASLTVSAPTFSPTSNSSTSAIFVTLQCATPGSVIHYTTDNSEPTTASAVYATPISVKSSMTIKAIAMMAGMIKSGTASSAYEIIQPSATSKDSAIGSLTTSPGSFAQNFSPLMLDYTDSVPAGTMSVTLAATARTSGDVDSIRYNGAASGIIAISSDSTKVSVIAYNKNGNTMTYTVTIIRAKPASSTPKDSTLASLTTNLGGLTSTFNSSTITYTDTVSASIASVTLTATATKSADVDSIRYNGASSGIITITKDTTKVSVIVYNKNRNMMTYAVTIIRLHATDYGIVKDDRDNNTYKIVTIRNQTWMASNLNYRNSTSKDTVGVCYNNSNDSCNKYGRLYTWAEAMHLDTNFNHRIYYDTGIHGICPSGFHLPSQSEWDTLFTYSDTAAMKSLALNAWAGKVRDTSKFQLQLAGYGTSPGFSDIGQSVHFWTRDQWMNNASASAIASGFFDRKGYSKYYQFSIRCVKN